MVNGVLVTWYWALWHSKVGVEEASGQGNMLFFLLWGEQHFFPLFWGGQILFPFFGVGNLFFPSLGWATFLMLGLRGATNSGSPPGSKSSGYAADWGPLSKFGLWKNRYLSMFCHACNLMMMACIIRGVGSVHHFSNARGSCLCSEVCMDCLVSFIHCWTSRRNLLFPILFRLHIRSSEKL